MATKYILLFSFILTIALGFLANDIRRAYVFSKASAEVVKLTQKDMVGTGFYIKAPSGITYILTNKHICTEAINDKIGVVIKERIVQRRVIEIHPYEDLCLLEALPGHKGLKLGSTPDIGDKVYTSGFPLGEELAEEEGYIKGLCLFGYTPCYNTSVPTYPGSSGSPLLNKWGSIVGIIFITNNISHWGGAVRLEEIETFIAPY